MQVRVHIFMVFMVMDLLLWPGYILQWPAGQDVCLLSLQKTVFCTEIVCNCHMITKWTLQSVNRK